MLQVFNKESGSNEHLGKPFSRTSFANKTEVCDQSPAINTHQSVSVKNRSDIFRDKSVLEQNISRSYLRELPLKL